MGSHRAGAILAVAFFICLGGCALPAVEDEPVSPDEVGIVGGYTPTDTIGPVALENASPTQREAMRYRAMARIEVIRGEPFRSDVDVVVDDPDSIPGFQRADRTREELWHALLVLERGADLEMAFESLASDVVTGYYSSGQVTLIEDRGETAGILVHELVHALQDQRGQLQTAAATTDGSLARDAIVEGEADYVVGRYASRCDSEWECGDLDRAVGETVAPENRQNGLYLTTIAPYIIGTEHVEDVVESDGWEGVDALHGSGPASMATLLGSTTNITPPAVEDHSGPDWQSITPITEQPAESAGIVPLTAALYHTGVIESDPTPSVDTYDHPATRGWRGDTFVAYENGTGATGFVWTLEWASASDAEEYADAYASALEAQGATTGPDETYRLPTTSGFGGTYRLQVSGATLEIVRAPTDDALEAIRPSIDPAEPSAAVAGD